MKKVEFQHSVDGKRAEEREGPSGGERPAVGGGVPLWGALADWG